MLLAVLSPNSIYLIQKWEAGHLIHLEEEKLESTKGECVRRLSFFWVFFSSAHNDSEFSGKYVREWQVEKKFKLIVKLTTLQASQKFFHLGHLALNMLCMLCVDQKKKKHKGGGSKIQEDEGVIVFADARDSPHQHFRVASLALWTARAPYPHIYPGTGSV